MDLGELLPRLLGVAWLLPLASFAIILLTGPRLGKGGILAAYLATGAIVGACCLSFIAFVVGWFGPFNTIGAGHHAEHDSHALVAPQAVPDASGTAHALVAYRADEKAVDVEAGRADHAAAASDGHHGDAVHDDHHHVIRIFTGNWYDLGQFGNLRLTIGYYIDSLTVLMFCMVTFIASCIHFYAIGYMHDELHEITDHEVVLADGHHLHRPGRFHRFFQYLSLFCFSMLGLVIAGNIFMVFVFWELVGVCSYFLIGFYVERRSASTAANKAFIVNRVGDFGMIIGLMALFGALGTFNFGDIDGQPGLFSLVRPESTGYQLQTPDGMVVAGASDEVARIVADHMGDPEAASLEIESRIPDWRSQHIGYGLLIVAGLGIFCGCVGKSAQFPLHVWLPDAMEGPTPVSALVHSATMVAAGVYLVGRFYPVFVPEVLLVIAYCGAITLVLAATIALTATDIKRVLAYSTVSQLGYMMLGLGVGGWTAGLFHLVTHAFFKSLLFMGSGSVIHATHTNDMTQMGGLRHKMPWTAYTMLVGCLSIIGAGLPLMLGFAGFHSKDSIVAQVISFWNLNSTHGAIFFVAASGGAALTAFYMFRLWYMTFSGTPRDHHIYEHAHESPRIMYIPLVILAVFAVGVGWHIPYIDLGIVPLLEVARPAGVMDSPDVLFRGMHWPTVVYPHEHASHAFSVHAMAGIVAFSTALAGFLLATAFYGVGWLNPQEVRDQFPAVYRLLVNKWYFDELYNAVFVRPAHWIAALAAAFDRRVLDRLIDGSAALVVRISHIDDLIDRYVVDGLVNLIAGWTWSVGRSLRQVQTGRLRQYVMFIVVAMVAIAMLLQWAVASTP